MADVTLVKLAAIAEQRWGLVTTAQAAEVDITRNQLSRMASSGVLERVVQGVYRMGGAPELEHQEIYATWLALGGASTPKTPQGVAPVVASGITAAVLHGLGDFFNDKYSFIVPTRKTTRLHAVQLRVRTLEPHEVMPLDGLPTLTVERTIADLVAQWTDLSLVAAVVRDAISQGTLLWPDQLVAYLDPVAAVQKREDAGAGGGRSMAADLFALAGTYPERWDRG